MVRDLLDANRIHAGKRLPLKLAECDLAAIARAVDEELAAIHGKRFVVEGDAEVRGVWSEADLHRALWNLALNGVKYGATDRPITITIRATVEGANASVHNEGAPISVEQQEQLFQPFSRAHSSVMGGPRGWGLGLTLVHGCAEAHGGRVRVTSDDANGTTFTIELPRESSGNNGTNGGDRPSQG